VFAIAEKARRTSPRICKLASQTQRKAIQGSRIWDRDWRGRYDLIAGEATHASAIVFQLVRPQPTATFIPIFPVNFFDERGGKRYSGRQGTSGTRQQIERPVTVIARPADSVCKKVDIFG